MYMIPWYQAPDCLIFMYLPSEVTIYSYQPGTSSVLELHLHMFTSGLHSRIPTFLDMARNLENIGTFSLIVLDRQVWANSEKEQSAQGLFCLPFCLPLLDAFICGKTTLFKWQQFFRVPIFSNFCSMWQYLTVWGLIFTCIKPMS